MTYDNRHFFDITTGEYTRDDLHPAERKLLAHFHGRWHDVRMLDLGVGTG